MAAHRPDDAPPPVEGGDGVRIVPLSSSRREGAPRPAVVAMAALVAVGVVATAWWSTRPTRNEPRAAATQGSSIAVAAAPQAAPAPLVAATSSTLPDAVRLREPLDGADPNDLASYFRPGDAAPTGAAVIKALQQSGIRTGLGAFNPPGTMPFLSGLAVPPDFDLPPGYVRHHQVTDEGEAIEPILMFAPDAILRDASGRIVALPADRIVPPSLAPPGLPLRWVRPGSP